MAHFDVNRANSAVEFRLLGNHQIAYALIGPQLPFYPLGPNESQVRQMLGQFQPDFWSIDSENPLDQRAAAQVKDSRSRLSSSPGS